MNAAIDISHVVLKTPRLTLRPWRESDLDDFFEYASVDGVGQMAGWSPHKSKDESRAILEKFIAGKKTFALEKDGKVVGSLGIEKYREAKCPGFENKKCRELGFVLAKSCWGQGLMPEAVREVVRYLFEDVGLDVIFCGHFLRNTRSARVQQKCGFRHYTSSTYETRSGTGEDDEINFLTREDYLANNRGSDHVYYPTLDYWLNLYDTRTRDYAFHAASLTEYESWKELLRNRLAVISGLTRCIPCEPVHRHVRTETVGDFTAGYHTLQTEPGIVMPFYLIRPDRGSGRHPVLIVPHGHGGAGRQTPVYQKEFIRGALDAGFIVACPDERGSGDRREFSGQGEDDAKARGNTHRELLQLSIGFGRSVIGGAVWDLMRLADLLLSMPDADGFLACAGMSGGGHQTLWFSAIDDRVDAAITSGYFYGMRDALIALPQNCACNYVPYIFETADMGDLGALIAPRYLFIESGVNDPLAGKRGLINALEQLDTTKAAYRLFDAEDRIVHSVHDGGHEWRGDGMIEFLTRAAAGKKESLE